MIFVLHFYATYDKTNGTAHGDTFPILTDLDYLTNHSSMKLSSFLRIERNIFIITGIFTSTD